MYEKGTKGNVKLRIDRKKKMSGVFQGELKNTDWDFSEPNINGFGVSELKKKDKGGIMKEGS